MTDLIKDTPCVYFISDGQGHCKIGVASDIYKRFNTLQVGSAFDLKVKHLIYTDTLDEAYKTENHYHTILNSKKIRGEWFDETSVDNILNGKTVDGEQGKFLPDFCNKGEFNFADLINFYIMGLECCKDRDMFNQRYADETPQYLKDALCKLKQFQQAKV